MSEPVEEGNPLAPDNIQVVQLITLLRIYDVLMALLDNENAAVAEQLLNLHKEGTLMASSPYMTGMFIADQNVPTGPTEN